MGWATLALRGQGTIYSRNRAGRCAPRVALLGLEVSRSITGVELRRYDVAASDVARFHHLLKVKHVDLVVDVGANEGQYGKALRKGGYRGSILSIEPLSEAYDRLTRATQASPSWQVVPRTAVGDVDGTVEMNVAGDSVSSSILPMWTATQSRAELSVPGHRKSSDNPSRSLSHPMSRNSRSTFLKVDAQGYEMHILRAPATSSRRWSGCRIEDLCCLSTGQQTYSRSWSGSVNAALAFGDSCQASLTDRQAV